MNPIFQVNGDGTVAVKGNLDRDVLNKNWWEMLDAKQRENLITSSQCEFDLSSVERVDSAGLAWLVNAVRDGRTHGVKLTLTDVPTKLVKLAKISGLDTLLPLSNSETA
ncbi:STAS domain-containing protein [Alteromonas ponticola]|uniref:STAS domain-containing protein n=1 Tax=Alteromonas aquimaris TaxID=2998417 RepID=A0ABT3P9K3_9ALTE|nr:STAS domain-containing protein [Alteromonas aquimaris]MCW8109463.1 STAS domain-containing protein [Alteromonas aquimaris]